MKKQILLIDNDLFFSARLADQLKALGFELQVEGNPAQVQGKAGQGVSAVIINLSMRNVSPVEIIRNLKAAPETAAIPVIAFGSHKNQALLESAQSAGCQAVLPNSKISSALPALLENLLQ